MAAYLESLEITDTDSSVYNFEIFKRGDNQQRGVQYSTKEWELGDAMGYWKTPLFPFDGGLRQDRLPRVASITTEPNNPRTYAKANADASNDGVLVAPPALTTYELNNICDFQVSFDDKQLFFCQRYVFAADRSGNITTDKDFGSGKSAVTAAVFNNELIVGMGETEKIWKRAVGATWTQASDSTFAIALGVVGNKLWRAESTNKLSNCITTPLTLANWTPASPNQYTAGDTTYAVHTIINYGGVPWALKADGAYAPDPKSDYYNQAPQMASWPHTDNGKGAFTAQGYLWVPTVIGLLRISPGESVIRGPEKSNRPDFRFWVRGGVEWGDSIYLLVTDESQISETFICRVDRDRYGLTLGQDYIYHEWCRLGGLEKGYTIGVNAWPLPRPQSVTKDAGTIANSSVASSTDWTNPTNASTSNNTYATVTDSGGVNSGRLKFSNFGFSLPSTALILGYIASIERKTSVAGGNASADPDDVANLTGIGTVAWTVTDTANSVKGVTAATNFQNYTSNWLVFSNFGFAIPAAATVTGITVTYWRQSTNAAAGLIQDNSIKIAVNGVPSGTSHVSALGWPNHGVADDVTYGTSTDTWGLSLTGADVNDTDFGVAVSVNGTQGELAWIGEDLGTFTMTVYYTATGTVDLEVKLLDTSGTVTGDDKSSTTSWPTSDATKTYGSSTDLWGTSFSPTDVADADFGFSLRVTTPAGGTSSVDYGKLTIVYQDLPGTAPPTLYVGHGTTIETVFLGFGAGRNIDDPNYIFGSSMEIESGLTQCIQDVTLVSGLIGISLVGKVRAADSLTLSYAADGDATFTDLLSTQEGGGTAAITGDGSYQQFTRYAAPNTTGVYYNYKLTGTLDNGAGTDRCEIRVMWAYGYVRPKVTDLIKIPIYCDRMELHNGIPQGRSGGDTLRKFRAWKRDQSVLAVRFADYEEVRTIRARVYDVEASEIIAEKDTEGQEREVFVANVIFMRDDFASTYGNS